MRLIMHKKIKKSAILPVCYVAIHKNRFSEKKIHTNPISQLSTKPLLITFLSIRLVHGIGR